MDDLLLESGDHLLLESGDLLLLEQQADVTIPVLDEGMLVGGLSGMTGGFD